MDDDVSTKAVEQEIQRRLLSRANKSPYQAKLDADKVGVAVYYLRRAALVLRSSDTFGLEVLSYVFDTPPHEFAKQLAAAVLKN